MKTKCIRQRILSLLLVLTMIFASFRAIPTKIVDASTSQQETTFQGDGYLVTYSVTSQWNNAFNADVVIRNTSDVTIDNWAIGFYLPYEITNVWNSTIYSAENGLYIIKNVQSNQDIEPNKSISFGFSADAEGNLQLPGCYLMMKK